MKPIACTLYLPDVAVWPVNRPIPFQLQMASDMRSLTTFACNTPQIPIPTSFLNLSEEPEPPHLRIPKAIASTLQFPDIPVQKASVRLFIARRVALDPSVSSVPDPNQKRREKKGLLWRMMHCGEGKFGRRAMGESCISWKGEIVPSEELATPGFVASRLAVEDYLVLSIVPPYTQNGGLQQLWEAIPMQFVTDVYREKTRRVKR